MCLGRGNASVKLYDLNGKLRDVVLDSALYIPSYKQNIFSVSASIANGASVSLEKERKYFKAHDGTMFGIEQKGRLYYQNSMSSSKNNASSLIEWHKIMGHCNFQDLRKLQNVVDGMKIADEQQCGCAICALFVFRLDGSAQLTQPLIFCFPSFNFFFYDGIYCAFHKHANFEA